MRPFDLRGTVLPERECGRLFVPALILVLSSLFASGPFASGAAAQALDRGLAVFADPVTLTREATVQAGEVCSLWLVSTGFAAEDGDGISAIEFGLEVDPRLLVVGVQFEPVVALQIPIGVHEWALAFAECVEDAQTPQVLARVQVTLAPGATDAVGARVGVRGRAERHGEIEVLHCESGTWVDTAIGFGDVVFMPAGPTIAAFTSSPTVVVENRPYEIGWATVAGDETFLDDAPVDASGVVTNTAATARTHTLRVRGANGPEDVRAFELDVIRTPRIERFTASVDAAQSGYVRLEWNVVGADQVALGDGTTVSPRGSKLVAPNAAGYYEIVASNEWGETRDTDVVVDPAIAPPAVAAFSAQPPRFHPGDDVVLSYVVYGATQVRIDPGVGSVPTGSSSVVVNPDGPTTFVLTASNANGEDVREVVVTPLPPSIDRFVATPSVVAVGTPVVLDWQIRGADDAWIMPGNITVDPVIGSAEVVFGLGDEVRLFARNAYGTTQRQALLLVDQATIKAFAVQPLSLPPGEPVQVTWSALGSQGVFLDPGNIELPGYSGSMFVVPPADSTRYVLRVPTAGDPLTATSAPVVWTPPVVSITASTPHPIAGAEFSLTVTTVGADHLEVQPILGELPAQGGVFPVVIEETTEFVAIASNIVGATEKRLLIEPAPTRPIGSLTASPLQPVWGTDVVLTAQIALADSARIDPEVGPIPPIDGTYVVRPSARTTYVLRMWRRGVEGQSSVTVTPKPLVVNSFLASPSSIVSGQSSTLSWTVSGAESIRITSAAGLDTMVSVPSGTLVVTPTANTVYTLTATNPMESVSTSRLVSVYPFLIRSFTSSSYEVFATSTVTLRWVVEGSADVELLGYGPQPLVGSIDVVIERDTRFTLEARNGDTVNRRYVTVFTKGWVPRSVSPSWSATELPGYGDYITPFVPFMTYVHVVGPIDGIREVEFGIETDPRLTVLSKSNLIAGTTDASSSPTDFILGLPSCIQPSPLLAVAAVQVIALQVMPLADIDLLMIRAASPSRVDGVGPAVVDCQGLLLPFVAGPALRFGGGGGGLAAGTIELEARRAEDRIELQWTASVLGCPDRATVLRASGDAALDVVHEYDVSDAVDGCLPTRFVDVDVDDGEAYRYQVVLEGEPGRASSQEIVVSAAVPAIPAVTRSYLRPNAPNPFNPRTELRYVLATSGRAQITVHDTAGRRVRTIDLGMRPAGPGEVTWTGDDDRGLQVASGVYVVRLHSDSGSDVRRVVLLR